MSKPKKRRALSHGRPKFGTASKATISSRATRTIIRTHHNLQKGLLAAAKEGNGPRVEQIQKEIEEQGGLKVYQRASILGQSTSRGGDSSKVLMQWLKEAGLKDPAHPKPTMLEVGALSSANACSKSGIFDVTRIDLNSQDPNIEGQDFMERPLPVSEQQYFDIISLSLVLNYVPDATGRGEMLRRTCQFLKTTTTSTATVFPALFLVLPSSCTENSRYTTESHLDAIMESLGYAKLRQKLSSKLVYSLWRHSPQSSKPRVFTKKEKRPGKGRNNFCIVLR